MSGFFESVRWDASLHRLDLSLYSLPKEFFGGMESEPMLTPREKIPSTRVSEEGRTSDAASHRTASPTHYRLSYSLTPSLPHPLATMFGVVLVSGCPASTMIHRRSRPTAGSLVAQWISFLDYSTYCKGFHEHCQRVV